MESTDKPADMVQTGPGNCSRQEGNQILPHQPTDTIISSTNFTARRMTSLHLVAMNKAMVTEANCPMSTLAPGAALPARYTWFVDNARVQVVDDELSGASGAELEPRLREVFRVLLERLGLHKTKLTWQLIEVSVRINSRVKMIQRYVDKWYLPTPKGKDCKVFLLFSPICDNHLDITASLSGFNLSPPSYVTSTTLKM